MLLAFALACSSPPPTPPDHSRLERCSRATPPPAEGRVSSLPAWGPPARSVQHLDTLPLEITGEGGATPVLRAWTAEQVAGWEGQRTTNRQVLRSPELTDLAQVPRQLRVRLRPGKGKEVEVVLYSTTDRQRTDARIRSARLVVPPDAAPDDVVDLTVDLRTLIEGNWGAARKEPELAALELTVPGRGAEVLEVALEGEGARYDGAAGAAILDLGAVLRPGLYLRSGATVQVTVQVPQGDPELRAWLGGLEQGRLELMVDGEPLHQGAVTDRWRPLRLDLSTWAGRTVTVRARAEGALAFLGDPRVIGAGEQTSAATVAPDVLVYMIDTLRADALGAWGSPIPRVSPTIDGLAAEGVQLLSATSTSPWTKPAIPTLMSGLYPTTHRVGAESYADHMPATVPLLQDRFRQGGWRTGSFVSNPLGSTMTGLERGFSLALPPRYWAGGIGSIGAPSAAQLHAGLLDFLAEEDGPVFAYVHTLEAHQYHRQPFDGRSGPEGLPYDHAVRAADSALGTLLSDLAALDRQRPLLLVLTSDHGESFGDHDLTHHGTGVYRSQVAIPLVFHARGLGPARLDQPVSLADVAPTILDLVGLPSVGDVDGTSLVPLFTGEGAPPRKWVPSSRLHYIWEPEGPVLHALTATSGRKLVRIGGRSEAVYDLDSDPCELSPVPGGDQALGDALDAFLKAQGLAAEAFTEEHGPASTGGVSADDLERMRALGYVE